ncbi:hypothetical protein Noda2021_05350 [Candidatus Dependentiae bacterium Noda2021]|nr:hypothetical protein Noda2021_05350 [Candidatus Dependentiae bacterium Noda2021]
MHTEPGHVDNRAGHEHSTLFNEITHVQLLKKQKQHNQKKSLLWGFSGFNGFVYSVWFALNQELLQPFVQSPVGLVAASACFTMLAAYNAKQCFNEKKKAEFDIDKLSSHIKVA